MVLGVSLILEDIDSEVSRVTLTRLGGSIITFPTRALEMPLGRGWGKSSFEGIFA